MASSFMDEATLHALTERLASHSRALNSLDLVPERLRQPAPPPQLPVLQISSRHQDIPHTHGPGCAKGHHHQASVARCPTGNAYPPPGAHDDERCLRYQDEDLDGFVMDMGMVLRREFDCWVEQCWTEAFHHLFTRTLPTLVIHLILTGSSPQFLRKQIVHGGPHLDQIFQTQILDMMYRELELRLSGARPSELGTRPRLNLLSPVPPPAAAPQGWPRDGVCFEDLLYAHGSSVEEEDHALCLCQLTACLGCFADSAEDRKGPVGLLPFALRDTSVAIGWMGGVESSAQAGTRRTVSKSTIGTTVPLPDGKGFVRNSKNEANTRPPIMFPHPQMTDVLAVEEHLRWRLKELGATDPAVESRYGPSTNSPAALEGVDLPDVSETSEDGSVKSGPPFKPLLGKVSRGKGKLRRIAHGVPPAKKKDDKSKATCYLPRQWADEDPEVRSMATVLTFRHFVKLLHQVATSSSPYSYPSYPRDIADLERVHPIALYRRLAEPSVLRRKTTREARAWQECMDKWAEELGVREKATGNKLVSENRHLQAVEFYTRAISLDARKTVYFSNRAVALNALGEHARAELDCRYILLKDSKNGKAFYQRALARKGMERWREAEADLREVLRLQPGNESAKNLMAIVKAEVLKLPKQSAKDALDF